MGAGLGFVLTACALNPSEPVIAIEGDSAFGFSGMELETLVRYRCRCVVVVFNNGGIYSGAKDNATAFVPGVKHDLLMEAVGGFGVSSRHTDAGKAVDAAFDLLEQGKYPVLLDLVIDPASGTASGSLSRM
jgi:oxalyl-CoA decarboxylase